LKNSRLLIAAAHKINFKKIILETYFPYQEVAGCINITDSAGSA
jgi:hypothetical protein